jgi:hypothetical protein
MARFKNTTDRVVCMQFGDEPAIVIAPRGEGDVPDRWVPWVHSREYAVEAIGAKPSEAPTAPPSPSAAPSLAAPQAEPAPAQGEAKKGRP